MSKAELNITELGELLKAQMCGYSLPIFGADGAMSQGQWASWKRLQRLGLATIEGSGEADDLVITDAGRKRVAVVIAKAIGCTREFAP